MRIWADVYDSTFTTRQGEGPIDTLIAMSVDQPLDGVGTFTLSAPATDERAKTLLVEENRIILYTLTNSTTKTEVERGIITDVEVQASGDMFTINVRGLTLVEEVARRSCVMRRTYSAQAFDDVMDDLIGTVSGWTVTTAKTDTVSIRFDGIPILSAIQRLCENFGYHFRADSASKDIEIADFGSAVSNLRLINVRTITAASNANDEIAYIERIRVVSSGSDIINRVYPLGAGQDADSSINLGDSGLSSYGGYTRQSVVQNGGTDYYIETGDTPVRDAVVKFDSITPASSSAADVEDAGDLLFAAAATWLDRNSVSQKRYTVTVRKLVKEVLPGDKIRVIYKGTVEKASGYTTYVDINDDFWVLSISRSFSSQGEQVTMEISNVDEMRRTEPAQIVAQVIREQKQQNIAVKPAGSGTITDFTSAQHDHEDAAGGGTLTTAAIASGTLAHERGGLEADVSGYNGLLRIASGSTSAVSLPVGTANGGLGGDVSTGASGQLLARSGTNGIFAANSAIIASTNTIEVGNESHTLTGSSYSVLGVAPASGRVPIGLYRKSGTVTSFLLAGYSDVTSTAKNHIIVYTDGDVENTNNSYGAISDKKIKENIKDAAPMLARLMQVKVREYDNLRASESNRKQIGMVSQELELIFPRLVKEVPDPDDETKTVKAIKYSLIGPPILIKAFQELYTEHQALVQRVAQLETQIQGLLNRPA